MKNFLNNYLKAVQTVEFPQLDEEKLNLHELINLQLLRYFEIMLNDASDDDDKLLTILETIDALVSDTNPIIINVRYTYIYDSIENCKARLKQHLQHFDYYDNHSKANNARNLIEDFRIAINDNVLKHN